MKKDKVIPPSPISFRPDVETDKRIIIGCKASGVSRSRLILMAVKAGLEPAIKEAVQARIKGLEEFHRTAKAGGS